MAQKYIIGDLVKYKVGGLEFIAEITNTSKYGYCFKAVSDDISGTLCKEFAKDIPLTTEILEKNGWEDSKKIVLYRQKTVGTSHRWFKGCKRPYSQGGGFKPVYTSRKIVFNRLRA